MLHHLGDAIILSMILKEKDLGMKDIDEMDLEALKKIARSCKVNSRGKSKVCASHAFANFIQRGIFPMDLHARLRSLPIVSSYIK